MTVEYDKLSALVNFLADKYRDSLTKRAIELWIYGNEDIFGPELRNRINNDVDTFLGSEGVYVNVVEYSLKKPENELMDDGKSVYENQIKEITEAVDKNILDKIQGDDI